MKSKSPPITLSVISIVIMDRLIPDSGLAIIKGTGHYSFLERKDVFRKILEVYFPAEDSGEKTMDSPAMAEMAESPATQEEARK